MGAPSNWLLCPYTNAHLLGFRSLQNTLLLWSVCDSNLNVREERDALSLLEAFLGPFMLLSSKQQLPDGASLIIQLVKNPPVIQETLVWFLDLEDPLEKGWATHSSILGLPCWLNDKESAYNAGDLSLIPGLGRSPGEGKGYPLQYSGLENAAYELDVCDSIVLRV